MTLLISLLNIFLNLIVLVFNIFLFIMIFYLAKLALEKPKPAKETIEIPGEEFLTFEEFWEDLSLENPPLNGSQPELEENIPVENIQKGVNLRIRRFEDD